MEEKIMNIILHAGDARSKCLMALRTARLGEFEKTEEYLNSASKSMVLAHKVQTNLIQAEVRGENQEVSLLMVHAQDHLMTSIAIKDIVIEMVEYAKELNQLKKEVK
uniref:PTS lactose/cellobiose transporter subunit IIA n=1 Tax=Candidatus Enterococcus willemsii TaxID=1857215 RepID=UPI00403F4C7F